MKMKHKSTRAIQIASTNENLLAEFYKKTSFFTFLECKANEELATMSCYAPFFVT
jgi:hypothetical protein